MEPRSVKHPHTSLTVLKWTLFTTRPCSHLRVFSTPLLAPPFSHSNIANDPIIRNISPVFQTTLFETCVNWRTSRRLSWYWYELCNPRYGANENHPSRNGIFDKFRHMSHKNYTFFDYLGIDLYLYNLLEITIFLVRTKKLHWKSFYPPSTVLFREGCVSV